MGCLSLIHHTRYEPRTVRGQFIMARLPDRHQHTEPEPGGQEGVQLRSWQYFQGDSPSHQVSDDSAKASFLGGFGPSTLKLGMAADGSLEVFP